MRYSRVFSWVSAMVSGRVGGCGDAATATRSKRQRYSGVTGDEEDPEEARGGRLQLPFTWMLSAGCGPSADWHWTTSQLDYQWSVWGGCAKWAYIEALGRLFRIFIILTYVYRRVIIENERTHL